MLIISFWPFYTVCVCVWVWVCARARARSYILKTLFSSMYNFFQGCGVSVRLLVQSSVLVIKLLKFFYSAFRCLSSPVWQPPRSLYPLATQPGPVAECFCTHAGPSAPPRLVYLVLVPSVHIAVQASPMPLTYVSGSEIEWMIDSSHTLQKLLPSYNQIVPAPSFSRSIRPTLVYITPQGCLKIPYSTYIFFHGHGSRL